MGSLRIFAQQRNEAQKNRYNGSYWIGLMSCAVINPFYRLLKIADINIQSWGYRFPPDGIILSDNRVWGLNGLSFPDSE
jgi:hypothetical protein